MLFDIISIYIIILLCGYKLEDHRIFLLKIEIFMNVFVTIRNNEYLRQGLFSKKNVHRRIHIKYKISIDIRRNHIEQSMYYLRGARVIY